MRRENNTVSRFTLHFSFGSGARQSGASPITPEGAFALTRGMAHPGMGRSSPFACAHSPRKSLCHPVFSIRRRNNPLWVPSRAGRIACSESTP